MAKNLLVHDHQCGNNKKFKKRKEKTVAVKKTLINNNILNYFNFKKRKKN
jgi:hypothetical protein